MEHAERISAAVNAHSQWTFRIKSAISKGSSEFVPAVVKTDNACDFGKWIYGDFPPQAKTTPLYAEIKDLHARFHKEAGRVLELALQGKKDEAAKAIGVGTEFNKLSSALVIKVTELKKIL